LRATDGLDGLLDSLSASGNKAYYELRSLPGGELPPERLECRHRRHLVIHPIVGAAL
jgi:hypothetical protein